MKTLYHRLAVVAIVCILNVYESIACGPFFDDPDGGYYSLFMQDIVEDELYQPFLFTAYSGYHSLRELRNENIEQWQDYFGISYENAYYLVFESTQEALQDILKGGKTEDADLSFITPSFVKKYKQAFTYLIHAKYLEPYMRITPGDSWYYGRYQNAGSLDYQEEVEKLKTYWKKTKDKDLKLRYGYQLVRFAHYNRAYEEAVAFFDEYVEPLNFRPAMYYHALSQKAGAERGLGNVGLANYHFLKVFTHSKNLKTVAALSMRINDNTDWAEFVGYAENQNELNDAYLLLGCKAFNDPFNEIVKIVENDPDAIQAKILMVRTINVIERWNLSVNPYPAWYREEDNSILVDKRYPVITSLDERIIELSDAMTVNPQTQDKNFWFMTSAYLHFLHKDFDKAKVSLDRVEEINEKYAFQKRNLDFYIAISEQPVITPEVEVCLFEKYKTFFDEVPIYIKKEWYEWYTETYGFVKDVLANRYYLQQDYAKSFLLTNEISELEENPQLSLLNDLEAFYLKPDKNPFEEYISGNYYVNSPRYSGRTNYLDYIRGIIYLTQGDFSGAHTAFQKIEQENIQMKIPDYIFGINTIECMSCGADSIMSRDYIADFSFIKDTMTYEELTATLLRLEEIGQKNTTLAAKANYLIGNFFYNTSILGYYRHILRFDSDNYYGYKYFFRKKPDIYNDIYFKYYQSYYENPYPQSEKYLQLAYEKARDRELKAHIIFALSKCEQGEFYEGRVKYVYSFGYHSYKDVLISGRKYFKELMKYQNTAYFKEVESGCKYFEYYVAL